MAVITLQTIGSANSVQRISATLKAAAGAMRSIIDSYVTYRMQTSASQAAQTRHPAAEAARADTSPVPPAAEPCNGALLPLEPGIISDVIPAFFVGRNHDGLWIAREAKGTIGGLFLCKESAISFAREQSGSSGCAIIFPTQRFELDIANSGNPLAPFLGRLIRFAHVQWRRARASSGASHRR